MIVFLFFVSTPGLLLAQNNGDHEDAKLLNTVRPWFDGSILTRKDEELKGRVKYDDRNAILSYQSGDQEFLFTPRSVIAFEFFDESTQKQRLFYSLEDPDSQSSTIRFAFLN